ncbi:MAG: DUF2007 domain-containing protein [Cellulophaga sp.]
MFNSNYTKIFEGNFILIQRMVAQLEDIGIIPVIKDESESALLSGFASAVPGFQKLYVNNDELKKAKTVIENIVNPEA